MSHISISEGVHIDIWPTPTDHGRPFLIGGNSDDEGGGWLIEDMEINVQHCSNEKQKKIEPHRSKYPIWWLVLIERQNC